MRLMQLAVFIAIPVACFGIGTEDVLAKLDQTAAKFTSMTATLTRLTYTKVIDDKSVEQGQIALRKLSPRDIQVLINFEKPDPRMVSFRGRKAEIMYPEIEDGTRNRPRQEDGPDRPISSCRIWYFRAGIAIQLYSEVRRRRDHRRPEDASIAIDPQA